jgi:hypothetical protein
MAEKSILDARLAEIDRRLRTIQSGLAPVPEAEAESAPLEPLHLAPIAAPEAAPVVPPEAAPVPKRLADDTPAALVSELRALVEAHERLLAQAAAALSPEQTVGVSAGPFENTEALRRFERALQALPEVRAVTVREYEGPDRVVIDVHLAQPNP